MKYKKAFITGISGQDGYFMTKLLLSKNYKIFGLVRNIEQAKKKVSQSIIKNIEFIEWNMLNKKILTDKLNKVKPCEFYNFAALSSGSGMFSNPIKISQINGLAVNVILESILLSKINVKLCQASSSEMFGRSIHSPQNELTPMFPTNPYGVAKLYAHSMIKVYRETHNIFACSAILFNHESSKHSNKFVIKKITQTAAKIKLGLVKNLYLGNINAKRDWGFAKDFVYGMWLMTQQDNPDDYVLATGKINSVKDICEIAFKHLGLKYEDYLIQENQLYRDENQIQRIGDPQKAYKYLGWSNKYTFREMICEMVDDDLNELRKDELI